MSVTQTVDIPVSDSSVRRRLTIDIPDEIPAGRTILTFTPASDFKSADSQSLEQRSADPESIVSQGKTVKPFASLWGIDKGKDTMDAYFARKRADKAIEDAQIAKPNTR